MRRLTMLGGLAVVVLVAVGAASPGIAAPATGEIAYVRFRKDARLEHLWISAADLAGRNRREITRRPAKTTPSVDHSPVWSPDGARIAFIREGKNSAGLFVVNRDGTGLRRLLRLPGTWGILYPGLYGLAYEAFDFSWSPDGQRLAFANGPLTIVNADGSRSHRLLPSAACRPSWSPDGKSLLYLEDDYCGGDRGGNTPDPGYGAIYRIDADGAHRRRLAIGSFGDASWSPDGSQIAFTSACEVRHGGDWMCSVSLMNADGSGRRQLIDYSYGGWVEWAAGGKELLWPESPVFYATDLATGRKHRVLPPAYKEGSPLDVSPDGKSVAVLAEAGYDMRHSQPVPTLIVVTLGGRLVQKVTVPPGWRSYDVAAHLS